MRNAHERFGILEYTKRMKDTTTQIRLRLDRFVGEVEKEGSKLHVLSVLGGDSDVGAIWAATKEEGFFTVQGLGVGPVTAGLGEDAQCFRGTISVAGRRAIRHLVAISAEVAKTRPGADREGNRTVLCNDDPTFCPVPGRATVRAAGGTGVGRLVHRRASPARCNRALTWIGVFASPREGHKKGLSEMDRKRTPAEANPVPRGERTGSLDYIQ